MVKAAIGLARDTVRASQVTRILLATAEVVAEDGYAETSVAKIARRAGVSTKTFYELYAGKKDAFLAAYAAIDVVIARMTTVEELIARICFPTHAAGARG